MNCVNCYSDAVYLYSPNGTRKIPYCVTHLPAFVRRSKLMTTIEKAEGYDANLAAAILNVKKTSPKKSTKVTIDKSTVVEEDIELNSIENDTTEEVDNESEPGLG